MYVAPAEISYWCTLWMIIRQISQLIGLLAIVADGNFFSWKLDTVAADVLYRRS